MKRKLIALLSACMLCIPFITPVYAEDVNSYWDGSYIGGNATYNAVLQQEISQSGKRYRTNYRPTETAIVFNPRSNGYRNYYGFLWYIGSYSALSNGLSDANVFREQVKVYQDSVATNANIYTTSVLTYQNSSGSFNTYSIQVGTTYRVFLIFCGENNSNTSSPQASFYTGKTNVYKHLAGSSLSGLNCLWSSFKIILGYDEPLTGNFGPMGTASDEFYLFNAGGLYPGHFTENVVNVFSEGNITAPNGGTGAGSNGNDETGVGNGVPNANGQVGSSTITFDGSDNQVQNQSQYQNQSIESNAVNVTVNNEISGAGGSSGSGESDVDRINALDNLLANQNVGTSFNSAIQNINNFRQLGVAFADTTTVFLGWLPSWVTALLGLMFTLLFFFIILRLLKVFHG